MPDAPTTERSNPAMGLLMTQDLASIILMGHHLVPMEAQAIEQKLGSDPDVFEERLRLIGYYYKHYYCCEPSGKRRIDHIVWLIRKQPNFKPMLMSYLHTHLLDRRAYACIKAAWGAAMVKHANNIDVICNMAAFVQFQEPELAEELYEKAKSIAPANAALNAKLERLRATKDLLIENRNSVTSSADSYFVIGAVQCPDAPKLTSGTFTSFPKLPKE